MFIITDNQDMGDLGCTGNPYVKTPKDAQKEMLSSGTNAYAFLLEGSGLIRRLINM